MNKALALAVAASVLVAASCAKDGVSRAAPPTDVRPAPQAETAPVQEAALASSPNKPWYASRFEALGFYVFPKPEPIPAFAVKTLEGKDAGLGDMAGKVVLLNFWATWCPPCRMEMPSIQALDREMKGKAFSVMAVSVAEKRETVKDFLKSNPYTFPIFLDEDGQASAPFAGRGIPTTFVLDKQGRAIAGIVGARSYDGPEVMGLFKELAEKLE